MIPHMERSSNLVFLKSFNTLVTSTGTSTSTYFFTSTGTYWKYRVNGFEPLLKQQEYELKAWCKHLQLFSEKLLPSLSAWLKGQDDEDDWVQRVPSTYLDNLINILNVGRRRRWRRRPLDDVPHHRREHGLGLRLGLGLTHRFEYLVRVGKRQSTLFIDATGELQSEHTVPAQACTPEPLDGIRAAAS